MKDLSTCLKCHSLTSPKPSGLCVKCECFAEIDSGLRFRVPSTRPPWVKGRNLPDQIIRVLCCGSGTPLPSGVSESDLDKPIEALIYEQDLLDQLKGESSSDSKTSA